MLTNKRVEEIALGLLKFESERDKQKLIGASDFSDPCAFHLAKKLLGNKQESRKYWLGAKIGTGVHTLFEEAIPKIDLNAYPELAGAIVEKKIFLGELSGYGTINSKPDLAMVNAGHLVDWKTSSRDKSRKMQRVIHEEANLPDMMYTLEKYYNQTQSYARGLNAEGIEIDGCSIVFVNRDGSSDTDVWAWTFPYDKEYADKVWERLSIMWSALKVDPNPAQFQRHDQCFQCKVTDKE